MTIVSAPKYLYIYINIVHNIQLCILLDLQSFTKRFLVACQFWKFQHNSQSLVH